MTTFLLIVMALIFIAALERANRRQLPHPPRLHGADDSDDRDWARTKSELLARGDQPPWNAHHRNGLRAA